MFPVVVPVLKKMTPLVGLVVAPSIIVFVTVLFDASLIKRTVAPVALVLRSVRSPVPPLKPSIVTNLQPFRSMSVVALEPVIVGIPPVTGLIVTVLSALEPELLVITIGKISDG